jgi:hypothetical protein
MQEVEAARAKKLHEEEVARQHAWEVQLQQVEAAKKQAMRDGHDNAEAERTLAWKDKRDKAEAANKLQAAQFRAAQQNKRKQGEETSTAPYKIPRKVSMFDYLKGPPPGC